MPYVLGHAFPVSHILGSVSLERCKRNVAVRGAHIPAILILEFEIVHATHKPRTLDAEHGVDSIISIEVIPSEHGLHCDGRKIVDCCRICPSDGNTFISHVSISRRSIYCTGLASVTRICACCSCLNSLVCIIAFCGNIFYIAPKIILLAFLKSCDLDFLLSGRRCTFDLEVCSILLVVSKRVADSPLIEG